MDLLNSIVGGSVGAAIVSGVFTLITFLIKRRDAQDEKETVQNVALRYILLYNIQERAKQHILAKEITYADRRLLHKWHDLYHNGLHGNGDADDLMKQVDELPLTFSKEDF